MKSVLINRYNRKGLKTGVWEEYYMNGNLDNRGSYVNGEMDGLWEEYWGKGQLFSKDFYVNGIKDNYH